MREEELQRKNKARTGIDGERDKSLSKAIQYREEEKSRINQ